VYEARSPTGVSWYQPHLAQSLRLIERTGVGAEGYLIDVGGGASTLVDDLLERGYRHVTVLDVSAAALRLSQERLRELAGSVTWLEGDATQVALPAHRYDIWHDRAALHFLTEAADRRSYVEAVRRSVKPGGHVIIAAFDMDGPPRCSGLPVRRYSAEALGAELGDGFRSIGSVREEHRTPAGAVQAFLYGHFQRLGGA